MQAHFLPASQPGAAPAWSALPFVLAEQSSSHDPKEAGGGETWLPWLTILVVIGLIITALFV
jgi:hypothetical protein